MISILISVLLMFCQIWLYYNTENPVEKALWKGFSILSMIVLFFKFYGLANGAAL